MAGKSELCRSHEARACASSYVRDVKDAASLIKKDVRGEILACLPSHREGGHLSGCWHAALASSHAQML